jgi:hypothetical protein
MRLLPRELGLLLVVRPVGRLLKRCWRLCRFRNLAARGVCGGVCGVAGGGGNRFEHGIYVGSSGLGVSACVAAIGVIDYDGRGACIRTICKIAKLKERGCEDIPSDWMNDETNPTAIATATETPPILSQLQFSSYRPFTLYCSEWLQSRQATTGTRTKADTSRYCKVKHERKVKNIKIVIKWGKVAL